MFSSPSTKRSKVSLESASVMSPTRTFGSFRSLGVGAGSSWAGTGDPVIDDESEESSACEISELVLMGAAPGAWSSTRRDTLW